jgi:hypothetical protein
MMRNARGRMMRKRLVLVASLVASLIAASLFVACLDRKVEERSHVAPSSSPSQSSVAKIEDRGDFCVEYGEAKQKERADLRQDLQENRVLEGMADELNKTLALPADVTLSFAECGKPDATYDNDARRVVVCYELIDSLYDAFLDEAKTDDELDDKAMGATVFVLYHELAHALIRIYKLPVAGDAESAADELTMFLLTRGASDGGDAAFDAAESLTRDDARNAKAGESPFWSGHALDQRRQSDLLCWLYAQDDEKYKFLVEDGKLPLERSQHCRDEYAQIERRWTTSLKPYLKNQ